MVTLFATADEKLTAFLELKTVHPMLLIHDEFGAVIETHEHKGDFKEP
jgi:hypothetical protein